MSDLALRRHYKQLESFFTALFLYVISAQELGFNDTQTIYVTWNTTVTDFQTSQEFL